MVFLPGTGLVPHGYSEIVADFASHGFHSLGLHYPSTQARRVADDPRPAAAACTCESEDRSQTRARPPGAPRSSRARGLCLT